MASAGTKVVGGLLSVGIVGGIVLLLFTLIFGTRINTAPDQVGLWYKAGPISSTEFDHCVAPGNREMFKGIADKTYTYPAGQRTYGFAVGAGETEVGQIVALTKDGIELGVEGVVSFDVNQDCKTLQDFHERIGLKHEAYMSGGETTEGWITVLNTYLGQSLKSAMNDATQEYTWKELYNNPEKKREWEARIIESLPGSVKQSMNGDYFNNYSIVIQKPTLPDELLVALRETQTAVEQNTAQEQKNATVRTELKSIKELVDVLGPDGYNTYKAIQDGKVSVMPIPQGSDVILNAPGGAAVTETEPVPAPE